MSFRSGAYLKIWEITPGERSTRIRCSSSRKNKQTNEYEQDFTGFVNLVGGAHQAASGLKAGDSIRIGDCEVTSRYDKEKKKEYINFAVFSLYNNDSNKVEAPVEKPVEVPAAQDDPDADLPF